MGSITRRGLGRRTALATAVSLSLAVVPSIPASGAEGNPSDLVEACDDAPSSSGKFSDYNSLSTRQRLVVDCLSNGYTGNNGETDYVLKGSGGQVRFDTTISRAQFASILNRLGDYLGLPVFTGDTNNPTFADVATGNPFFGDIEELYKRGLTKGAGSDTEDVDNDGDTDELIYNPGGQVSYAQILSFVKRLLGDDGAGLDLPTGQSHNEYNQNCGIFNGDRDVLDEAGFLRTFNTPSSPDNCTSSAKRGLVFDLAAVGLDLGVELDAIENPFAKPFGAMTALLDDTSKFTDEFATVTVTVLDENDDPVVGQKVDIFGVNTEQGFNQDGSPTSDPFLNVNATGRSGSGDVPGQVDVNDPSTDANGQVNVTIGTSATQTASFTVHAFHGDTGARWADAEADKGESADAGTITFAQLPTKLVVKMNTSSTNTLPYGTSHTVEYTLLDAEDNPVLVSGLSILSRLDRDPSQGDNEIFVANLATNENGTASWTRPGAPDPNQNTTGQSTVDTFSGTWDRNRDGVANGSDTVTTQQSGTVTFRDLSGRTFGDALIEIVDGNSNIVDQTGAVVEGSPVNVKVTVTNIYGAAIPAMRVDVRTSDLVQPSGFPKQASTNASGVATVGYVQSGVANDLLVAWVDANDDTEVENPVASGDEAAESETGDGNVRVRWVNPAPEQVPGTTNTYSSQTVVGYNDNFVFLDQAARRLPFDGGGTADLYSLNGDQVGRATFLAAIKADEDHSGSLSVTYDADHISSWSLTVDEGSESPIA